MQFETNLVLVTGSLGWLGISLVQALVEGLPEHEQLRQPQGDLQIRCLILPGQAATPLLKLSDRIEVVTGDLRSPADCERFCQGAAKAIVFHTAGIIHPRRVTEFYDVNVVGTKNLLRAAAIAGVQRAVIVSSNSPCGCNPHPDHRFDERSPYNPYMNYGRSKMLMEKAVQDSQQTRQIETVLIRAPWFYGPNQPPRQTLFFQMIRDGKAPLVGTGQNQRSMAYIGNLCQGLLLAALVKSANGEIYWIADERPYPMTEIIDTIERLLETEFNQTCAHKRLYLPGLVSEIALWFDAIIQRLGFYHQKIHVLSEMNKSIACSTAKAQQDLGYVPAIDLEEGMRRSLTWMINSGQRLD
ncbi:MAG: NAD-dependent epimerase/dehydratase family protein [Cyanobacteria bacterium P01_G01_bin.54]